MKERVQRWASILVGAAAVGVVVLLMVQAKRPKTDKDKDASTTTEVLDATVADASLSAAVDTFDGSLALPVPTMTALPSGAPRTVKLGVVLVQFEGAEGASSSARAKKDALVVATKLAADAKTDFKRAVAAGDSGSSEDIGRVPRGILDPPTEIAVFSLGVGDISEVLETPRGYWIVKRVE